MEAVSTSVLALFAQVPSPARAGPRQAATHGSRPAVLLCCPGDGCTAQDKQLPKAFARLVGAPAHPYLAVLEPIRLSTAAGGRARACVSGPGADRRCALCWCIPMRSQRAGLDAAGARWPVVPHDQPDHAAGGRARPPWPGRRPRDVLPALGRQARRRRTAFARRSAASYAGARRSANVAISWSCLELSPPAVLPRRGPTAVPALAAADPRRARHRRPRLPPPPAVRRCVGRPLSCRGLRTRWLMAGPGLRGGRVFVRVEQAIFGVGAKGLAALDKVYPNVHVGVVRDPPERTAQFLQVRLLAWRMWGEAVGDADRRLRGRLTPRAPTGHDDHLGRAEQLVKRRLVGVVLYLVLQALCCCAVLLCPTAVQN